MTSEALTGAARRRRPSSTDVFTGVLLVVLLGHSWLAAAFSSPALAAWATVFVAVCVQAMPFLVLGVLLSTAISTLVPAEPYES